MTVAFTGFIPRSQFDRRQKLRDIAGQGRELQRACGIFLIVREQFAVFFQRGAAPGRICDDGVVAPFEKRVDIFARQTPGDVANSGVNMQRSTARLRGRNDDFAAIGLQHAHGSFIQSGKGDIGDTAGHERYAVALRADGREDFAVFAEEERDFGIGQ